MVRVQNICRDTSIWTRILLKQHVLIHGGCDILPALGEYKGKCLRNKPQQNIFKYFQMQEQKFRLTKSFVSVSWCFEMFMIFGSFYNQSPCVDGGTRQVAALADQCQVHLVFWIIWGHAQWGQSLLRNTGGWIWGSQQTSALHASLPQCDQVILMLIQSVHHL